MRVVRSTVAHGKIVSVDSTPALAMPGVDAVWTFADVADIPADRLPPDPPEALAPYRQTILARDRCAMSASPSRWCSPTTPTSPKTPPNWSSSRSRSCRPSCTRTRRTGEFADGLSTEAGVIRKEYGDVDAAFSAAHAVVSPDAEHRPPLRRADGDARRDRRYDAATDMLEMYGAAKVPHWNRDQIASMLGRAAGQRQSVRRPCRRRLRRSRRTLSGRRAGLPRRAAAAAAGEMDRGPPRTPDRHQSFAPADPPHPRRDRRATDASWRSRTSSSTTRAAMSAPMPPRCPTWPRRCCPGPYRVPAYRAIGHIRLTNKTPGGTYRAPGRYESTFVRERLIDAIAAKTGIDPVEVRRRNLIDKSEMPFARHVETLGTDVVLDSGDYARLLDKALNAVDWPKLQAQLKQRRQAGELVGAGVAMFVEKSGLGPFDDVRITVDTRGRVEVVTGAASVGQGVETVIAQICADTLGVDYRIDQRHPWPDRPHRARPRRIRLARHGHDRRSHPARRDQCAPRRSKRRGADADRPPTSSISSMARSCAPTAAPAPPSALAEIARPLRPAPDSSAIANRDWRRRLHSSPRT